MIAALMLAVMAWSGATNSIVVARDGRIEAFDRTGQKKLWSSEGVANASAIVVSEDERSAAVIDGFGERVAVVSLADGAVEMHDMPGTPVGAAFLGHDLWVILRDHSSILHIAGRKQIPVALDPAFIVAVDGYLYVYSRADGVLQELDPKTLQVRRMIGVDTAGSDLEVRGPNAYICRPSDEEIVVVDLPHMTKKRIKAGKAPIDLAFVPFGAKLELDPGTAIIADPASRQLIEARDPGSGKTINLPSPCDRVIINGAGVFAQDSNSGALYRIDGRRATKCSWEAKGLVCAEH